MGVIFMHGWICGLPHLYLDIVYLGCFAFKIDLILVFDINKYVINVTKNAKRNLCKIIQIRWWNSEHFISRHVLINRQAVVLNMSITFFELLV